MKKVLITGATGTVGSALVKELLKKEEVVVLAGSRNPKKSEETEFLKPVYFDFSDPQSFSSATEGVEAVFLLGPPLVLNLDELLQPFIDHLGTMDQIHVVYLSALAMDKIPEMPFHTNAIAALYKAGIRPTVVKPTFFAQNFLSYERDNILNRKLVFAPAGKGKAAFISAADIAAAAAVLLSDKNFAGQEFELTGPELLSYQEVANLLSEILGEPIVYPEPDPQTYAQVLQEAGAPPFVATYMNQVYGLIRDQHVSYTTNTVLELTGRPPVHPREVFQQLTHSS
jgi:uncharacterized protein YbjT (DUF2867 family)